MLNGDYDVINKAVLTVCPFKGSINALVSLIEGEGGVKFPFFNSNDEFRRIARTFPAVYELCPTYEEAVVFASNHSTLVGTTFDILNPEHWQSNIQTKPIFLRRLAALKEFINAPATMDLVTLDNTVKNRTLIIVGEGEDTMEKINVKEQDPTGKAKNFFDFKNAVRTRDGDGTVPMKSSTVYKDHILTLAVKSKFLDKATHGFFLNDGRVQTIITRFIKQGPQEGQWWTIIGGSVRKV